MEFEEKLVSVKADIDKNRLYTTLKGHLSKADIFTLPEDLRHEANKLKPGYLAISDVSEYKPISNENLDTISKIMEAAIETKMGTTIRVVSDASESDLQKLSSSKHGYKAFICRTLAEAEKLAKQLEKE
jgi:DNA repair photolyase